MSPDAELPPAEIDACLCVPDNEVTVRDADTGIPQEYVRDPGLWGWFTSGWQDVVCPLHARHLSPFGCSRCDARICPCGCHHIIPPEGGKR